MQSPTSQPPLGVRAAWALGMAGLVPFFVGAAALWAGPQRIGVAWFGVAGALLTHGATIASFLGGVRWGVETVRPGGPGARRLFLSVTPQLAAWGLIAAPLPGIAWRFGGLALLLAVQGAGDAVAEDLPPWFRSLRMPLTVGAAAAMAAGCAWGALHPLLHQPMHR